MILSIQGCIAGGRNLKGREGGRKKGRGDGRRERMRESELGGGGERERQREMEREKGDYRWEGLRVTSHKLHDPCGCALEGGEGNL